MFFEVVTTYPREGTRHHARLKASNGRIIFWTQDYTAKQNAYEAIYLAQANAATAPIYEVSE